MSRLVYALILAGVLVLPGLVYAEDVLSLTPAQLDSLGVRFEAPQAVDSAQGSLWSGMVSVPPQGFEQVVAPLAGRVVRVEAASGQAVSRGQALLALFSPEAVGLAQALQSARASEALAVEMLARERRLWKEGIGIERRVREAEAALQQARIEREAAQARAQGAGLQVEGKAQLGAEVVVRAPRAGTLLSLGTMPGAWLAAGEVVAEVSSTTERWVEAEVPIGVANALRLGQVVKVDVQDGAALSGKVLAIGAVVEPGRQTVMVRVVLAEANVEALRPGLRVSLRFAGDAGAALWRVPRAALVQVDGALSLFVLRKGKVLPLAVETQGTSEAQPALRAAFVAGDQVAVAGAVLLKGAWDGRGGAAQ